MDYKLFLRDILKNNDTKSLKQYNDITERLVKKDKIFNKYLFSIKYLESLLLNLLLISSYFLKATKSLFFNILINKFYDSYIHIYIYIYLTKIYCSDICCCFNLFLFICPL